MSARSKRRWRRPAIIAVIAFNTLVLVFVGLHGVSAQTPCLSGWVRLTAPAGVLAYCVHALRTARRLEQGEVCALPGIYLTLRVLEALALVCAVGAIAAWEVAWGSGQCPIGKWHWLSLLPPCVLLLLLTERKVEIGSNSVRVRLWPLQRTYAGPVRCLELSPHSVLLQVGDRELRLYNDRSARHPDWYAGLQSALDAPGPAEAAHQR
jgi:hypothetical protein